MSIGTVIFIYVAEVTVDAAIGFVSTGQYIAMLLLSCSVEFMIVSPVGTQGTFWFYAGLNLLGCIFIAIFVKETRGLPDRQKKRLY